MTILGDWGTTRLRLFLMDGSKIIDQLEGPGIGALTLSAGETLSAVLAPWRAAARDRGVLLCGMAGSRDGLTQAPYAACPIGAAAWRDKLATIIVDDIEVSVAAGLSCTNFIGRPDVIRGEETQIFGAFALNPALAEGRALLVLPGTHSKWVKLLDGRVQRFHTFPTGELFALLRKHSTLAKAGTSLDEQESGFLEGLVRSDSGVIASLFEARATQLIEKRSLGWALGFLSGLLIGSEFVEALALVGERPSPILLIGDPALVDRYATAAERLGVDAAQLDGDACAIAGLTFLKD